VSPALSCLRTKDSGGAISRMNATRDIRLLVCDEQSAYRAEVRESTLVAEGEFGVYFQPLSCGVRRGPASRLSGLRKGIAAAGKGLEGVSQKLQQSGSVSAAEAQRRSIAHHDVVFAAGQRLHLFNVVQVHDRGAMHSYEPIRLQLLLER